MPFPGPIDLAAVTRLTRAGKLKDALGVLKGLAPQQEAGAATASFGPASLATLRETIRTGLAGVPGKWNLGSVVGLDRGSPATPEAPAGARFESHSLAPGVGRLDYKLYVPARAGSTPMPLVVMLHGCTQSPDDFAAGTRMNELAEAEGFCVAYPAQSRAANAQKCWNWFRAGDQGRNGEPALIAGMVRQIMETLPVDPRRVYVAGLSAGGAAAAVLGQTYPELFAAVGVHSGLACGAASDVSSAFTAMKTGGPAPRAGGGFVPTIVFHGDRDATVAPINGTQVIAQAEGAARLVQMVERGRSSGGLDYTRTVQADARGLPMLEHWVLHGAGHAWSGGSPSGSYTDPRGPDASGAMWRFFRDHALQRGFRGVLNRSTATAAPGTGLPGTR